MNGQVLLCAFNLGIEPASFDLPRGVSTEPLRDLGFGGTVMDGSVSLAGQDAFFAWLTQ